VKDHFYDKTCHTCKKKKRREGSIRSNKMSYLNIVMNTKMMPKLTFISIIEIMKKNPQMQNLPSKLQIGSYFLFFLILNAKMTLQLDNFRCYIHIWRKRTLQLKKTHVLLTNDQSFIDFAMSLLKITYISLDFGSFLD